MKNLTIRSKNQIKKRLRCNDKENIFSNLPVEKIEKSINQAKRSRKMMKINIILKETINVLQEDSYNSMLSSLLQTKIIENEKSGLKDRNKEINSDKNNILEEIDCLCSTNDTNSLISKDKTTKLDKNFLNLDKISLELDTTFTRSKMIKIRILNEDSFLNSDSFLINKTTKCESFATIIPEKRLVLKANFNFVTNSMKNENEYILDIFENLIQSENCFIPSYGYMKHQTEVNKHMRAILVDWIIDVHKKFNFQQETLHLTVNLLDRYLSKRNIKKTQFQLLGVTCLFIAAKYEEIYRQELNDFIYVTDNTYSIDHLLEMEREVLDVLEFNLTITTANKLLEVLNIIYNLDSVEYNLARYFLEIFCLDYRITNYPPSIIAFSCMFLVDRVYRMEDRFFDYAPIDINEAEVKKCAKEIMFLYENIFTSSLKATKNKFSKREFNEVAALKLMSNRLEN